MPCLWGQTEHPKQAQTYGSRHRRSHWITVRSPGRTLSDRDPSLTTWLPASVLGTAWALGTAWGNPSPAPATDGAKLPVDSQVHHHATLRVLVLLSGTLRQICPVLVPAAAAAAFHKCLKQSLQ